MINVAIYTRVSTAEQAKDGYSIGEQIERLTKYCEAMKWRVYRVFTDPGYSGADTNRPALTDMISEVKKGKIDKIVVYKLDRLSRSQLDTLYLIEKVFLANNTDFVSISENFDTSTPFGRAMIGILAVFAQLEREQIKERMSMGAEARAKEGKWRGGIIPYGYDYKNGMLTVNEFEAMIIREMYHDFVSGKPMHQLESDLNAKGYTLHGKVFSACNIRYILSNKLYSGMIRFKGEWLPGTHEPIIDDQTLEKSLKLIESNRQRRAEMGYTATKSHTTYLGGLLFCGQCGGKYGKRAVSTGSARHNTYVCYSRHKKVKSMVKNPDCMNTIYRCDDLDNLVFGEIRKLALDHDYLASLQAESTKDDEKNKIRLIEAEIKNIDKQISRFMDLYGTGRFSFDQLDGKIIPLEERRNQLQTELNDISNDKTRLSEEEAQTLINSFGDVLENGSFTEIRAVIEGLIDKIVIDGDNINIYWRFT